MAAVAEAASDAEKLEPKIFVGVLNLHDQLVSRIFDDVYDVTESPDNAHGESATRNVPPTYSDGTGVEGLTSAISLSENWIAQGGENVVWLPPDYRATCAAFYNNLLVLGHRSGQVTFFKFSAS